MHVHQLDGMRCQKCSAEGLTKIDIPNAEHVFRPPPIESQRERDERLREMLEKLQAPLDLNTLWTRVNDKCEGCKLTGRKNELRKELEKIQV